MKALDATLLGIEEILLKALFVILPLLCLLQVISRFILHIPVPWSEEAMRVLFMWATFIGASLAVKRGAHLSVTALVNILPEAPREIVALAIGLVCAVLCLYFSYNGLAVSMMEADSGETLPVSGLPTYISSMAIPIGFLLMAVRFVLVAIERRQRRAA